MFKRYFKLRCIYLFLIKVTVNALMIELINVPHTLMFDALFSVLFLSKVSLQQLQTLKRISIYFLLFREIFDTKGQ